MNKDPDIYRPDIVHQCLLNLLDSPLNKAGLLEIFIHTHKNMLIRVHPQTRIPRTYSRFAGLMVQLLRKLHIKTAGEESYTLLKVIANPVTDYLPSNAKKIALEKTEKAPVKLWEYTAGVYDTLEACETRPVVYIIGGFAKGSLNVDYKDEEVSISSYPLSASMTCLKLCSAYEELWGIL
mmetsp:Transcript_4866/g.7199  ORF Transcript_4866/g.7199 Transcript_4866/m.7199 type:complete len:180 (+) Transcript_4866:270-809(+)